MDLLKVFKVLMDKDIRLYCGNCFIENLTINDIVYSTVKKGYYMVFSEDTGIIISENLEFQEVSTAPGYYYARPENGGLLLISRMDAPIYDSEDTELDEEADEEVDEEVDLNELDELDIELDFDESDFLEE